MFCYINESDFDVSFASIWALFPAILVLLNESVSMCHALLDRQGGGEGGGAAGAAAIDIETISSELLKVQEEAEGEMKAAKTLQVCACSGK